MTDVERILVEEVRNNGVISFERFMELALYQPGCGYYEKPRPVGRAGDFFTSVSAGSLFGRLLAWEFEAWASEQPFARLTWLECGAHDGRFAEDFLEASQVWPESMRDRFTYVILEPSSARRERQQQRLARFTASCHWIASWTELRAESVEGCVFSNELFDAMPARRYGWDATQARWFEWGVTFQQAGFEWCRLPLSSERAELLQQTLVACVDGEVSQVSALEGLLPDAFVVDLSPHPASWWRAACGRLARGSRLMAFDYGFGVTDLFHPSRKAGTLRAYCQHRVTDRLLELPGDQDLTFHVNFDDLQMPGEQCGLLTNYRGPQGRWLGRMVGAGFPLASTDMRQFQTLTHPGHMGASHTLLLQARR